MNTEVPEMVRPVSTKEHASTAIANTEHVINGMLTELCDVVRERNLYEAREILNRIEVLGEALDVLNDLTEDVE